MRRLRQLEEEGLVDVYIPLEKAPRSFWEAVLQAAHWCLLSETNFNTTLGRDWWDELRWQEGWPPISNAACGSAFTQLIRDGRTSFLTGEVDGYVRLSAIEHLIDVIMDTGDFAELVNEAADRFRVGVRLEGSRFVDLTSELIHQQAVRPALQLLTQPRFRPVDDLYRKGFDRLLAGDSAGAVTAATSALEEMLRVGGCVGAALRPLAQNARQRGWITAGVEQSVIKLEAYRGESDAHRVGTEEDELARLVLNLVGSLLLYLGRTSIARGDDTETGQNAIE